MKNKQIMNHIIRFWYIYLFTVIVVSVSFTLLVNSIVNKPLENNITIYAISDTIDIDQFKNKYDDITINYIKENDSNIKEEYKLNKESSDIFIISETFLIQNNIFNDYLVLDEDAINEYCDYTFEYYIINENAIGIKVYDKDTKDGILKDCFSDIDRDYYLFINANKFDELNSLYDVLKYLIK